MTEKKKLETNLSSKKVILLCLQEEKILRIFFLIASVQPIFFFCLIFQRPRTVPYINERSLTKL